MIQEKSTDSQELNVLVIGFGSIAQKHINAINVVNQKSRITALRSSQNAVESNGVNNIFSLKELDKNPDFIIISNPTNCHYSAIDACVEFGVPMFIEKPVLHKRELGGDLAAKLNRFNIITYVGCNLRFLDCLQYIKSYLDERSPRINEINVYSGSYLPDWRSNRDFRETYSAKPELGGGVHLDLIHELDYVRWMLGKPDEITKSFRANSSLAIRANDYANYLMSYQGFAVSIILNYYRSDQRRTCEILLERETISIDLLKNRVTSSQSGVLMESKQTVSDTYVNQMQYFLNCVRLRQRTFNDFCDGLEVLSMCL